MMFELESKPENGFISTKSDNNVKSLFPSRPHACPEIAWVIRVFRVDI